MKPLAIASIVGLLFLVLAGALMSSTGCASGANGATTQPAIDPQTVKFLADLAIEDAIVIAGLDPRLSVYVDAALKAKATLDNADPSQPQYMAYVKAANDAALDLILASGKVKNAARAAATQPSH